MKGEIMILKSRVIGAALFLGCVLSGQNVVASNCINLGDLSYEEQMALALQLSSEDNNDNSYKEEKTIDPQDNSEEVLRRALEESLKDEEKRLEKQRQKEYFGKLKAAQEALIPLINASKIFDSDTPPHDHDGSMNGWASGLLNIVKSIDESVQTINPDDVKNIILNAADDNEHVFFGRTMRGYIIERYNNLQDKADLTNKLQQVIGWTLSKNVLNLGGLPISLIPLNDSTSAIYNVFFAIAVPCVDKYIADKLENFC